jgi:hypothetical protein
MYKFHNWFFHEGAGSDGTAGGGGTPPSDGDSGNNPPAPPGTTPTSGITIDPNSPEVRALIDRATSALKTKNEELIGEKRQLTELFGDVDRDTLKSYVNRLKTDEESRLIAEGKVDEVVDRRTSRMRDSYQSKLEEFNTKLDEREKAFNDLKSRYDHTLIDNAIRDAALKEGVVPSAIDDIIFRGRSQFQIDNERLVSKDPDTNDVRLGADGKTPYGPPDFMADLKKVAPHFWPSSSGGGYTPGGGNSSVADLQRILQTKGMDAYMKARKDQSKK